ncbi:hypothetical protein MMC13_006343 [Lambiella insularis]|nr:hypothetical protein [Lambiella insularis]
MLNSTAHLDTIASLCKDPLIPRDLAASADIQRQIARYMTTLDCQLDPRTKSSLIKLCEQDLDLVRKSFEDIWSGLLEIELLGAKIYIYGMSFVSSTADDTDLETEISSLLPQDFLQCGLAAAVRLLYTARHLKLPAFPSSTTTGSTQEESKRVEYNSQLVYYPKHLFRLIAFANFFLLWFLAVDFGASEKDKELARNYVTATHRLFKSFEQSPEHVRYGKMIEVIGRMPNIANLNGSLRVTSRLGASFMYDIIRNSVLYREASRHAQDVHVPLSTYQENNGALSSELPQEASLSHQTSLSYSVSDGTSPGLDQDTQMPYFQEDSSGRFASFDQGRSPNSYQDSAPNADFPWGLWDDAVYDSLHMETNLSQLPPDANINIRQ